VKTKKTQKVAKAHPKKPSKKPSKKMAAKRAQHVRAHVRRVAVRRIDPVWVKAVADIVASCVARQRVQGADVHEATHEIAASLAADVPRAARVLVLRGHPPSKSDCRCHAYALLEVQAYDAAQESHLPPDAIFSFSMRSFDHYMNGRN